MRILKYRWPGIARTAWKNRQEIIGAHLSRRELLKLGLLTTAGLLLPRRGLAQAFSGGNDAVQSPPTTPWREPLPIPPVKQPVPFLSPAPQINPLPNEGRTRPHQALLRFPPQKFYEVRQKEANHSFHPGLPTQPIWGFDGIFPGPTYMARYGEPILVRNFNELPQAHVGFGIPQVSTHLHNSHTPSESDGYPCDFFPFQVGGPETFYDHHYPNALAGFSSQYPPHGDPREAMSTLWYHDHRADFTASNVYKGLAGFYLLFNEQDTGNETTGFRLPSGQFDVPLLLADKLFDENGQLYFDLFGLDGLLGDKFTVNGKVQPYFQVHPRKYRFRILNGGPSRFYKLFLTNLDNTSQSIPFTLISNDGNMLPNSLARTDITLAAAERMDIIIDFSQFAGKSLYLENRMVQTNGRGPTGQTTAAGQGNHLLRFDVVLPPVADYSLPPPYSFYAVPTPSQSELDNALRREWNFTRSNGQWAINNQFFDCDTVRATIKQGSAEIWTLRNFQTDRLGWSHPIHSHFEEFQLLKRGSNAPPLEERGRKDVLRLGANETVEMFTRFRDFTGRYVMHCHNTIHEDHAMMLRWDIVP